MSGLLLLVLTWLMTVVTAAARTVRLTPPAGSAGQPPHTLHAHPAHPSGWLHQVFDGFTWTQGVVITAALIAAAGVVATILTTASRARRDRLADLYADALSGVTAYIEGPYRIRRRAAGNHDHRFEVTRTLSDVKARIDHAQNMLTLHARPGVTAAYNAYVDAAKTEAGGQMHDAWKLPGINDDVDVNLHFAYPREKSDRLRVHVLAVMQADLAIRALKPWTWCTYWQSVRAARAAARPPADPAPVVGGSEAAGTPECLDTNTAETDPKAPTDPLH